MKDRPGMMFYFSDWEPLFKLGDASLSKLVRAALKYAHYGEMPELTGAEGIIWEMLVPKIDRDGERFEELCIKNRYNRYRGIEKAAGRTPLEFDEWLDRQRSSTVVNDGDQLQLQTQTQLHLQQQGQGDPRGKGNSSSSDDSGSPHDFPQPYRTLNESDFEKKRQDRLYQLATGGKEHE